ncbi:uncharacterized protein LOC141685021 [Apium graveolens]|uniref:uncharacterized protein LOC141685021 n=1 Tax=Apium graveolens TaxID=4045 RepID=UPI003D7AED86
MNCLSWNCRGLGNPRTVRVLGDLLKDRKPDILFLSETIYAANKIEDIRIRFGFVQCFSVDRVGRSGGLAIMWKNHVNCQIFGYSRNHIDVHMLDNNMVTWRLTYFYGYPERSKRRNSWDLLRQLAGMSQLPWLIVGDFNDLLYSSNKWGLVDHPQSLMDGFRQAVENNILTELELRGGRFTWEKSRGKRMWVKERLDRSFAMAACGTNFHCAL